MEKVVLFLGSKSDLDEAKLITKELDELGIPHQTRIASAHRTPEKVITIVRELEKEVAGGAHIVGIAVVGLSNALSGMIAGISALPLITCPIFDPLDINSNLRMPPGVAHATLLRPKNAALYAAKILGISNPAIREKVENALKRMQEIIETADADVQKS